MAQSQFLAVWGKPVLMLLDHGPFPGRAAALYRWLVMLAAAVATAVQVVGTVDGQPFFRSTSGMAAETICVFILSIDLVLQVVRALASCPEGGRPVQSLRRYLTSPYGLIDQIAVLPFWIGLLVGLSDDLDTVFGVVRFLKLARYSPALETLGSVVRREGRPLQSATFIMALLMLGTSTCLYLVERAINPDAFGSIPQAMWWSVATLTTLGYGDAVPISPLGKLLGGATALLGVGMFALPASILATGFAEEVRRRDFLTTWRMVAKVPFFIGLDADQIAGITALLKFFAAAPGDVLIRRGDLGDRMFFIVSGVVSVDFGGARPVELKDGDFFGEIALLRHTPRTATVTAASRCQLLILDVRDFRRFIGANPRIAEQISETAKQRLSEQNGLENPSV